ncbi:DUF7385 family protein [Haladaptatus sp. NG-WS-4]
MSPASSGRPNRGARSRDGPTGRYAIHHRLKLVKDAGQTQLDENRDSVACPVCDAPFVDLFLTERREQRFSPTSAVESGRPDVAANDGNNGSAPRVRCAFASFEKTTERWCSRTIESVVLFLLGPEYSRVM